MPHSPVVTSRWRTVLMLCGLSLVTSSACIDDPLSRETADVFPLSERDASLLGIQALREALLARLAADTASPPAGMAGIRTIRDTATLVVPCALGGTVRNHVLLEGSVDSTRAAVLLTFTISQQHDACRELVDGVTQTKLAAPGITSSLSFVSDGTQFGVLGSIKGGLVLLREGTAGKCDIDLTLAGLHRPGTSDSYAIRGQVCDRTIDENVTVSASP